MNLRAGVLALFALSVTGCNGGSSVPYQPLFSSSVTTSTSGSVPLPSLSISGYTVTGTLPPASAAVAIHEAISASAPSGVTPLSTSRQAQSRQTQGAVVGTASNLLYITFTSSASVTLTASPALTFTAASIAAGTVYNIALFSDSAWTAPFEEPQTGSAGSVSFPSTNTPVTIGPSSPATFVLYTGDATTTAVALVPSSLSFDAADPSSGSFGASEVDYSGAFSATMTCTENPAGQSPGSNAFVAEFTGGGTTSSQTPSAAGGSVTFNVSSGAETGTCTVAVSDTNGNSSTETISVSSTNVTVTGNQRK